MTGGASTAKTPPTATFVVDAGAAAGLGHVARCSALAGALHSRGWRTVLAAPRDAGSPFTLWPGGQVIALDEFLQDASHAAWRSDLAVVDHYGLGWTTDARLRGSVGRLLVIDDAATRGHDCDMLLDQTFGREPREYEPFVPSETRLLAGTDYALLRPEFAALRDASLSRRRTTAHRVLISLGGSAAQRVTPVVTRVVLAALPDAAVVVAMTPSAPGLDQVQALVALHGGRVRLLEDPTAMARELLQADLAVGAAGTSAWERCCLGVPAIVMVLAENQRGVAAALEAAGAARRIDPDASEADLTAVLATMDLGEMSSRAARVCDGRGADRVAVAIEALFGPPPVYLRRALIGDSRFVWETNNAPDARRISGSPEPIAWEEHSAWFARRIADPDYRMFVIEGDAVPCGVLRFSKEGSAATISVALTKDSRGRGRGSESIRRGCRLVRAEWPIEHVFALIRRDNVASLRAFERAGFGMPGVEHADFVRCEQRWPPFVGCH